MSFDEHRNVVLWESQLGVNIWAVGYENVNSSRYCQRVFQKSCINLPCNQQEMRISVVPHLCHLVPWLVFSTVAIQVGVVVVSQCGFHLHLPDEPSFLAYWPLGYFFNKVSAQAFPPNSPLGCLVD